MKRIIATTIMPFALLLVSLGAAPGQGTIRISFDGPPEMPPGGVLQLVYYFESGVNAHTVPSLVGFTRRWSGGSLFPDNGTAYLQPARSQELFFTYMSGRRFDAVSVDLALYSASSLEPVTVQFVASGYSRHSDIIATAQFTVAGVVDAQGRPAFQTFYFPPEFRGMYYLSVMPTAPLWSLDNLVIIPEPSVGALFLLGALGLWLLRRRTGSAARL